MGAPFSFSYGDPGIGGGYPFPTGQFPNSPPQVPSGSGGSSNPSGSILSQLLPWASLGAQTFLADQAITSPRPSTVTYLPNGQIAATGGGAPAPLFGSSSFGSLSSIPGLVWVGLIALLLVIFLVHR